MELVVYIAIMGIIVIVAGQAFSNSTKFRVRNQSMIEANEVAGNIAALIKDDIAQMGAKSSLEKAGTGGASDEFLEIPAEIYMNPASATSTGSSSSTTVDASIDSSSFTLTHTDGATNLTFRRINYDNGGKYVSVEEVSWFLDGDVLKRSCRVVGKSDTPCADGSEGAVEMAEGVSEFSIIAGEPEIKEEDEQMFPQSGSGTFMLVPRFGEDHYNFTNSIPADDGKRSVLTGFASNFDKTNNKPVDNTSNPENTELNQLFAVNGYSSTPNFEVNTWSKSCKESNNNFTFEKDTIYEISFEMTTPKEGDKMELFRPGKDYLAVGFRNSNGNMISSGDFTLEDFIFFPPVTQTAKEAPKRSMRFSVKNTVKGACLVFTFASYSPEAPNGTISIKNLRLKRLATSNRNFSGWETEAAGNISKKKNVKAFKLSLGVKRNGEEGKTEQIIETPSNGPRD